MPDERKPTGPIGSDDIDDWASAIGEWEDNLPVSPAPSPPPVAAAAAAAPPVAAARPAAPASDEPAPLDAPPAPPTHGKSAHDPLMQLFDGEMDLPEEAGEALGGLLGNEHATPQPGPLPTAPHDAAAEDEPAIEDLALDEFGG